MDGKDYYVDPSVYERSYSVDDSIINANFDSENPYEVLGVNPDNSLQEITRKRNELAKIYHPDFNNDTSLAIQKINDAYDKIKNEKSKENDNSSELIQNTNIPMPKKKQNDETYEEYEEYLHEHYKKHGKDYEITYYPNTNIPKPRMLYPHELINNHDKEYYMNMLKYFGNKYNESLKNNNTSNTESTELAVVDNNKNLEPVENTPTNGQKINEDEHEVKGIRKATDFLKKHKKALLIAAGLTAAVIIGHAYLVPALMQANSTLWASTQAFPLVQNFLHGCNLLLGKTIGATYASTGLWTSATGALINAEAAKASVLGALTLHAANIGAISYAAKKLIEKIKNRQPVQNKNTNEQKNNVNVEVPLLEPAKENTSSRQQQLDELKNQRLLLGENDVESVPYENQGGIRI